jgi:hypothetical protein
MRYRSDIAYQCFTVVFEQRFDGEILLGVRMSARDESK